MNLKVLNACTIQESSSQSRRHVNIDDDVDNDDNDDDQLWIELSLLNCDIVNCKLFCDEMMKIVASQ